ncbi:hypothetical protein AXZ95_3804 [Leifsonia sp. 115AMFTsu3.1]|nr:hypothetical protein AXZ95_3804 [Leifsonia sp. 115AMFTsu3.1]
MLVFTLTGCGVVQALTADTSHPRCDTPTKQETTVNDLKTSRMDEAALKEIYETCQVTFDLTTNKLLKEDLGLPATSRGVPDIVTDGPMTLTLRGSQGTLTAHTDHVTFFAPEERADVSEIAYFLTADTPEEFFTIIRDGAEAYGFDKTSVEREIKYMKDYPDVGSKVALQPGYKLGFQVVYDLRYRGPGNVNTVIVSVNPTVSEFEPLLGP